MCKNCCISGGAPIGIVTSFIGVPFFLWLLRKSDYLSGGNNR